MRFIDRLECVRSILQADYFADFRFHIYHELFLGLDENYLSKNEIKLKYFLIQTAVFYDVQTTVNNVWAYQEEDDLIAFYDWQNAERYAWIAKQISAADSALIHTGPVEDSFAFLTWLLNNACIDGTAANLVLKDNYYVDEDYDYIRSDPRASEEAIFVIGIMRNLWLSTL